MGVTFFQNTTTGNKRATQNYYPKNDNAGGIMGSLKQHLGPYAIVGTVECNERKKNQIPTLVPVYTSDNFE